MAHHPPLYALQRSLGHEPQIEIDSRTDNDIKTFLVRKETRQRQIWVRNVLLLADDLMNCSDKKRARLKEISERRHPNTARFLETILNIASNYDLLNPEENLKFSQKVVRKLKIGSGWYVPDEVKQLCSMLKRT